MILLRHYSLQPFIVYISRIVFWVIYHLKHFALSEIFKETLNSSFLLNQSPVVLSLALTLLQLFKMKINWSKVYCYIMKWHFKWYFLYVQTFWKAPKEFYFTLEREFQASRLSWNGMIFYWEDLNHIRLFNTWPCLSKTSLEESGP